MSWAAELLTELCCAGSHLYLHPWHYIVKSRALRIFGGFLLLFFFFCIDFTMLCPTATELFPMEWCPVSQQHHWLLEGETAFMFGVLGRWERC